MINANKQPKFPENCYLKVAVIASGKTVKELAEKIGVSRPTLSLVVNGHYKGQNIIPALKQELGLQ
ncbi:helix-turn-helix domain-containing protein [Peijinzhouia sedimentorum]